MVFLAICKQPHSNSKQKQVAVFFSCLHWIFWWCFPACPRTSVAPNMPGNSRSSCRRLRGELGKLRQKIGPALVGEQQENKPTHTHTRDLWKILWANIFLSRCVLFCISIIFLAKFRALDLEMDRSKWTALKKKLIVAGKACNLDRNF